MPKLCCKKPAKLTYESANTHVARIRKRFDKKQNIIEKKAEVFTRKAPKAQVYVSWTSSG
jgi:hypothetical protein